MRHSCTPRGNFMAIDYEKEYDNRGRVPEHPEIFARNERDAAAYRAAARGAELGLKYGPLTAPDRRPVPGPASRTAGHVHPWRLVARARPVCLQPSRRRAERAGRQHRGGRLRSLPAGVDRNHHRTSARCLPLSVA